MYFGVRALQDLVQELRLSTTWEYEEYLQRAGKTFVREQEAH